MDQWDSMKNAEVNSCINGKLIYEKKTNNTQWRKGNLFNTWCWKN